LLPEARKRTKALIHEGRTRVQRMLSELLAEAGWTDKEFIDALEKDLIQLKKAIAKKKATKATKKAQARVAKKKPIARK
jgi:hypothetical protein